jgi:predicted O-methyltransferase YrrM
LLKKATERFKTFDVTSILPEFDLANEGAVRDVLNREACGYYQWIPGFIDLLKPKQIVELGGAMGVWDICVMAGTTYKDFKLYTITLEEGGLEFCFINDEQRTRWSNLQVVIGDDLNLSSWPPSLYHSLDIEKNGLGKTDLWFLDSEHTESQLRAELELYKPYFKPGAILLFDDIHLKRDGQVMDNVWNDMEKLVPVKGKYDLTNPLHWSGYGLVEIK